DLVVIGDDRAAFEAVDALRCVKTEYLGRAEAANRLAFVSASEGVRRIKYKRTSSPFSQHAQPFNVACSAPQMDTHDRTDIAVEKLLDLCRIEIVGGRFHVAEHRLETDP